MESFFERYRNHLILLAVLAVQIIGLATQVRRSDAGRNGLDARDGASVRLIRLWADAIVSPPERLIHNSVLGVEGMWSNYIYLQQVRKQNQDLEKTIDRLRLEQASLLEDARQGQRLQALLGFQETYIYSTVAAQAFGTSGSDQSKVFYIDKGSADGLSRDMAVISGDGIVGKVRDVFPRTAQVLAINDQTSGAGVILESTRIRGILKGNAAGELEVVGLLADQRIQPGERVLTAGGDLIFPRGLPVGAVEKVVRDPDRDSFIDVMVKPAAHLDRLDEVLIITSTEPRFPANAKKDMATSEALKGAEATALQDQLKASQIMAERLPGLTDPGAPASNPPANGGTVQAGSAAAPATAAPPPKLLPTLHPDRFSPAANAPSSGKQPDSNPSRPQAPDNGLRTPASQPPEPGRNP